MKEAIVVIPVYKEKCTDTEDCSLKQTVNILGNHDISIACPQSLDVSRYVCVMGKELIVERFPDNYFSGIEGYNHLCLSQEFYRRFNGYRYMLICHVDAWVFRDELHYWCEKGYDYIGAPLHHISDIVGNGGFSLRKISRMIQVLNRASKVWTMGWYVQSFSIFHPRRNFCNLIKLFSRHNNVAYLLDNNKNVNEDVFLSSILRDTCLKLRVPTWQEALLFAVEGYPEYFFKKINYRVPFGSHGQWRFWKEDTWNMILALSKEAKTPL